MPKSQLPVMQRNDEPRMGPAMAALRPRWQEFVRQLFHQAPGHGNHTAALRAAGISKNSSKRVQSQHAYKLMHDPRIQKAIVEESQNFIRATGPSAAQMLNRLVLNENHRDHARALGMILDRVAPIETKHVVDVRHTRTLDETLQAMNAPREQLTEFFGEAGLRRYEALLADKARPVIEVTAVEVKND
jgi:phage terminase small subunit